MFCGVFITWIGTGTLPGLVADVDAAVDADDEEQEEEYDNDDGITVLTTTAGWLRVIFTGNERNKGF